MALGAYADEWVPDPDVTLNEATDRMVYWSGELEACCGRCKACKHARAQYKRARREIREAMETAEWFPKVD